MFGKPSKPIVSSTLADSALWASHAVDRLHALGLGEMLSKCHQSCQGRRFTMSTGCSGILTFEIASNMACFAMGVGLAVECLWAVETSMQCPEEILAMPGENQPRVLYDNYDHFLQEFLLKGLKAFMAYGAVP